MKKYPLFFHSFLIFIICLEVLLFNLVQSGNLESLPEPSDAVDYESIGYQLFISGQFSHDWDNQDFLKPYQGGRYKYLQERTGSYLTANRPPLFPFLIAVCYKIFGRVFFPIRIINIIALAVSCAMLATWSIKVYGIFSGYIFTFLFISSRQIINYAALPFLTEALAVLFTSVLTLVLMNYAKNGSKKYLVLAAVAFALSILNRSIYLLWLPIVVCLLFWLHKNKIKIVIGHSVMFSSIVMLILLPWMVRNCLVLQSFMPFGTHGAINMPAAYSDKAIEKKGEWFNLDEDGVFNEVTSTGLQREIDKATIGMKAGRDWMRKYPLRLPELMFLKSIHLWHPHTHLDLVIFVIALISIIILPLKSEQAVIFGILSSNTFAVALTWSVGERFLVPVLPLLFYLLSSIPFSITNIFKSTQLRKLRAKLSSDIDV